MKIHGIDFGPIWGMSGVQNFFGEGWPYHELLRPFGLDFSRMTFIAKTTTLLAREGKMPLKEDLMPKELLPKCIYVDFVRGIVLNAVSLSGPGLQALLEDGRWQARTKPFQISIMSVAETTEEYLAEIEESVRMILFHQPRFKATFGVQWNLSCPNTGHGADELFTRAYQTFDKTIPLGEQGIANIAKVSIETPPEKVIQLSNHPNFHAVCASNTVKFGNLPDQIDWEKYFGKNPLSPLIKRGIGLPGGLSGEPLRKPVLDWTKELFARGMRKPVNIGGGILHADDLDELRDSGVRSYSIGSVAILRGWRVADIIERAYALSEWPIPVH